MAGGFDRDKRVQVTFLVGSTVCASPVWAGGANSVFFELPTFASGLGASTANVYCQAAAGAPGTAPIGPYYRIMAQGQYSAGAAYSDIEVPSTLGAKMVAIPMGQTMQWLKMEVSNAATAATYLPYIHVLW